MFYSRIKLTAEDDLFLVAFGDAKAAFIADPYENTHKDDNLAKFVVSLINRDRVGSSTYNGIFLLGHLHDFEITDVRDILDKVIWP